MATKKKKSTSTPDKKLKAAITSLRSDLASTKAKRDGWKKRAVKAEAAVADLKARLKTAEKKVRKAKKSTPTVPTAAPPAPAPAAVPEADTSATDAASPDESWTVAQLRAEARRRGLAGMSSKPKAELLAALR